MGVHIMSSPVEGVSSVQNNSSGSSSDAYDWFYNPEYQKGIEKGVETQSSVDKQGQEQTKEQIAQLYESLGQTPPNQSGGSAL